MSVEDLKKQVWVLTNEKAQLKQHNERIEHRLNEYVKWSEQAQKIIEENKATIDQLTYQNQELSSKVKQGTVAMSQNLLDENSAVKRQLQELQENFQALDELINPLVMRNINNLDLPLKRKLITTFRKGNKERQILSLFIENPSISLSIDLIVGQTGLSHLDCSTALKQFEQLDYVREIQPGVYQTIQAVGDKIVSSKDLQRVSIEILHQNIKEQINKAHDSDDMVSKLEAYGNELKRRNQTKLTQDVFKLIGDLRMARRSSDWIIDKLEELQGGSLSQPVSAGISHSSHQSHVESLTTPSHKHNPATYTVGADVNATTIYSTHKWSSLSNTDVIEKVKQNITTRTKVEDVIDLLTALKNHLETSVSGRLLYNIQQMINQIKSSKAFDKEEIHKMLYELSFKV